VTGAQLRTLATTPGQPLTFTCTPPGSGARIGIDRDRNGVLDGDEPGAHGSLVLLPSTKLKMAGAGAGPMTFPPQTQRPPAATRVAPPRPGSGGDPTHGGGTLMVYNAARLTADAVAVALPAAGWRRLGSASHPRGWSFRSPAGGPVSRLTIAADRLSIQ